MRRPNRDAPVDRGRVIAFNFDPIHRLLSRSDFRLVWNAILNWNDLPPPGSAPRAAPPADLLERLGGGPGPAITDLARDAAAREVKR